MAINPEFKKKDGKVDVDKWAKKWMKSVPWGKTVTSGYGESKPNVMSNEDRRKLGVPQDPGLPDYLPNEENK